MWLIRIRLTANIQRDLPQIDAIATIGRVRTGHHAQLEARDGGVVRNVRVKKREFQPIHKSVISERHRRALAVAHAASVHVRIPCA